MKKRLFALALALTMLLALMAGCSGGAAETAAPADAPEAPAADAAPAEPSAEAPAEASAEAPAEPAAPEEAPQEPAEPEGSGSYMESLGYISDAGAKQIADSLGIVPTTEYFPLDETKTLTATHVYAPFVTTNLPTGDMNEKLVFVEMEKLTNVHVEWTPISMMSASEDYQLLIASGDYPDLFFNYGGYVDNVSYEGSVDDEILVDLTPLIDQYCPCFNYLISNNKDVRIGAETSKGYLPEFMGIDVGVNIFNCDYIRGDWLKEMGVDSPTTYDALHDVLSTFRDDYSCACPMWIPDDGVDTILLPGFGVTNGWQLDGKGDVIYGPVQDGFREYLQLMAQWYSEGLFSVEFMSLNNDFDATSADFVNNGVAGVFFTKFDTLSNYSPESSSDPDFEAVPFGCVTKQEGDNIEVMSMAERTYNLGQGWAMSTDCEDQELVARWCDFWYTEAGSMLANYGVLDYTYTYAEDGRPVWTDVMINNPDMAFQPAIATLLVYKGAGYVSDAWKELQIYSDELIEANLACAANQTGELALPTNIEKTGEEETEEANYNADIETAIEESVLQFITGSRDINDDAQWQTYVDTIESLGLQEVHDIELGAYERYLSE